jgi:hypothetical protein
MKPFFLSLPMSSLSSPMTLPEREWLSFSAILAASFWKSSLSMQFPYESKASEPIMPVAI